MNNNFFNLSPQEQSALIKRAGDRFDISDIIIEKDLWICWLLEKLFALPIQMAFKGGTSLSKVFSLINRFSEDCDITIDYRNFKNDLDLRNISRAQLKKISDQLKEQLKTYVAGVALPYLQEQVREIFPEKIFGITLSEDGEQLRFYYPTMINSYQGYLRDHVLIEFGIRNSIEPSEKYQIQPYLVHVIDENISLPKPIVNTLSPIRTFWEKATLIHVECYRDRLSNSPDRLSRHWYDLFMLKNSWVSEQALSRKDILIDVLEHKKAFFNASYAHYEDCLCDKFRLIPEKLGQKSLSVDFSLMIEAAMFYKLPPTFDTIIKSLKDLEKAINQNLTR